MTVSARIEHGMPLVTMSIYAHLPAGDDEAAAETFAHETFNETFAALVSAKYHGTASEAAEEQVAGQ
jgi:hypothetical protein